MSAALGKVADFQGFRAASESSANITSFSRFRDQGSAAGSAEADDPPMTALPWSRSNTAHSI